MLNTFKRPQNDLSAQVVFYEMKWSVLLDKIISYTYNITKEINGDKL